MKYTPEHKRQVMLAALDTGKMIRVAVVTACPGVVIPERFLEHDAINLDFGYGAAPPIRDIRLEPYELTATLHFTPEGYFRVAVPWDSVLAIYPLDYQPPTRPRFTVIQGGKN